MSNYKEINESLIKLDPCSDLHESKGKDNAIYSGNVGICDLVKEPRMPCEHCPFNTWTKNHEQEY